MRRRIGSALALWALVGLGHAGCATQSKAKRPEAPLQFRQWKDPSAAKAPAPATSSAPAESPDLISSLLGRPAAPDVDRRIGREGSVHRRRAPREFRPAAAPPRLVALPTAQQARPGPGDGPAGRPDRLAGAVLPDALRQDPRRPCAARPGRAVPADGGGAGRSLGLSGRLDRDDAEHDGPADGRAPAPGRRPPGPRLSPGPLAVAAPDRGPRRPRRTGPRARGRRVGREAHLARGGRDRDPRLARPAQARPDRRPLDPAPVRPAPPGAPARPRPRRRAERPGRPGDLRDGRGPRTPARRAGRVRSDRDLAAPGRRVRPVAALVPGPGPDDAPHDDRREARRGPRARGAEAPGVPAGGLPRPGWAPIAARRHGRASRARVPRDVSHREPPPGRPRGPAPGLARASSIEPAPRPLLPRLSQFFRGSAPTEAKSSSR